MAKHGETHAQANKRVRQESLRELLRAQGHEQYILENIVKLEALQDELSANEIQRLSIATNKRLSLLNKYLPDMKAVEFTDPDGNNPFSDFIGLITQATKDQSK